MQRLRIGEDRKTVSRRSFVVGGGMLMLAGCVTGSARQSTLKRAGEPAGEIEIAALLRARVETQRRGTGAAAAVIDARGPAFVSFGHASLARTQAVGEASLFQIASLTKIFTAYLLADAVERGELALLDPLSRHVSGRAPSFEGREFTLLDLATHSSGLPLRPPSRADRGQDNPYAGYAMADLLSDTSVARLTRAPGSAFDYSNFGYALLGMALSYRAGKTYWELLRERILEPLEMEHTTLQVPPRHAALLVQGYDAAFQPMANWDFGALAPAGGLFSSLADLGKFMTLWCVDRGAMSRVARRMLNPLRPGDDSRTSMGLGWRVTPRNGRSIAWSNGTGGGVRSFMALDVAAQRGALAFINMATGTGVDDIGFHMLDPASPVDMTVTPQRIAIDVAGPVLDRYAGRYQFAPGDMIEIVRTQDGIALAQGTQRIALFAETQSRFFIKEDNVTLEFSGVGQNGRAAHFIMTQGGETFAYQRVD